MAAVEARPPLQPDSIYRKMKNWARGEMFNASVERARPPNGTDGTDAAFISGRMLNPTKKKKTWMMEQGSWDRVPSARFRR